MTITGVVADPGVYEIEWGTRLRALVRAAGGLTSAPRAAVFRAGAAKSQAVQEQQ